MNYAIEVVTAETVYPVSTSELKTHLGITHTDHDTMLADIIIAACKLAEAQTWVTLGSRTLRMHLDSFYDVVIPRDPISAVTSITYYDMSNVQQTLAATAYDADLKSVPARIHFKTVPSTYDRYNAVQINFTAGHATIGNVEGGIKQAIKMVCADMYDQRMSMVYGATSRAVIDYSLLFQAFRKNYFF